MINEPEIEEIIREKINFYEADIDELIQAVHQCHINDEESEDQAVTIAKKIADLEKRLELVRKDLKEPYLKAGRLVDNGFRTTTDNLKAAKTLIKERLKAWIDEKMKAEAEWTEEDRVEPRIVAENIHGSKAFTRKRWRFKVVMHDIIPKKFLMLNHDAINAEISAQAKRGETPTIAGLEIWQDEEITVR